MTQHLRRVERTVVLDPGHDGVGVAHPRHVGPLRIGLAARVADLDVGALPRPVGRGRPRADGRVGTAVDAVLHAHVGLVAIDPAHLDLEVRRVHWIRGVGFLVVLRVAEHCTVAVDVVVEQQDSRPGDRRAVGRRDDVGAEHAVVGRQVLVGDLRALPDPVLEVVVPAVGEPHFDAGPVAAGGCAVLDGVERHDLVHGRGH